MQSVAATADFRTGRINGTTLLDQALNLKTPTIYDTVRAANKVDGVAKRPVNRAAHHAERPVTARIRERMEGEVPEREKVPLDRFPVGHFTEEEKHRKQQVNVNEHA